MTSYVSTALVCDNGTILNAPSADGTSRQLLSTNGSGQLSFISLSVNDLTDYPTFGSAAYKNLSWFCQTANNLSDVNAASAKSNLGLSTVASTGVYSDLTSKPDLTLYALLSGATFSGAISATNLSGTNTGNVSLSGTPNYLSLAGQVLTMSAIDLSGTNATGTLAAGRFPALTGDVTTTAGSLATTIAKIAALSANGFVKTSGGTGALSVDTNTYVNTTQLGATSGVATLDGSGTLTASQIPTSIRNPVVYKGTWNASTNTPTLVSSTGTQGYLYKVGTAGTTTIDGISQWNVGDQIVFNGTVWDKWDGVANEVLSVAGRTGAVTLTTADVSTSINGLVKGNGSSLSVATSGTDYQAPITLTTTGTSGAATFSAGTLNIPNYATGGSAFSGLTGSTNTTAAMVVGTGASLTTSGSGTITATAVPASGITGTTLASTVTASSLTSAAGGSFGTAAFVATGTSGATIPLLNGANIHSGATTFSAAGAASTPGVTISGAPYAAGTTTTNFPQLYMNWGATGPTTFSSAGTALGFNSSASWTGTFIDCHINGAASVFSVTSSGAVMATAGVSIGSSNTLSWNSGGSYLFGNATTGSNTGTMRIVASGGTSALNFGGDTSSFPALIRSTTTLKCRLADDSGDAGFQSALNTINTPNITTTSTDGLVIQNATASTSGVPVQYSGRMRFIGHAWNTTTPADNQNEFYIENQPVSGATPTTANLLIRSIISGGAASTCLTVASNGNLTSAGSITQNGATLSINNSSGGLALNSDTFIKRIAAATIQLGNTDAASPVAQTLSVQNVVTGTSNTAGVNWTFSGSKGTGTGAGGNLVFQVAPASTTGTTPNSLVTFATVDATNLGVVFSKHAYFAQTTLTDAATIAWDVSANQAATVTLGGNRTLSPSNMKAGASYTLLVKQDGTGSRTLGYTNCKWAGGSAPTLSTGAGKTDILTFISDGTSLFGVCQKDFS